VSIPLTEVSLSLVELAQPMDISKNSMVIEVKNGMVNGDVQSSLFSKWVSGY
jgi:hypothetical protein